MAKLPPHPLPIRTDWRLADEPTQKRRCFCQSCPSHLWTGFLSVSWLFGRLFAASVAQKLDGAFLHLSFHPPIHPASQPANHLPIHLVSWCKNSFAKFSLLCSYKLGSEMFFNHLRKNKHSSDPEGSGRESYPIN